MSESIRESIYQAIASIRLVDPHTHINPHNPASQTLADILGYHYYTELVHSAGMPKELIEQDGISPRELVSRLVTGLPNIENTANYQWLINICKTFFDFQDDRITESNWESLYDAAEQKMSSAQWPQMVLDQSNVEAVFLTNDFDDDLEGFDTRTYIPCLRTDDLVFHLGKTVTRDRLAACSGIELDGSIQTLRDALRQRFEHFVPRGARACAISIPPDFQPTMVSDGRAQTALDFVLRQGTEADASHHVALSRCVFWTLAELCDEFEVPFDLMIGVNRGVYPEGVYQGQDLYDSRVSLIQYKSLFNAFPDVKFPISVLASVTNQELVSYAWIFPNVITNGHWWYSNTPSFISRDAAARLEAVPKNKQIGYYSDAYKLEFVWPKFDMYRHILADILADHFVGKCGWSEERAIELGYQVLRGNVDTIFPSQLEDEETAAEEDYVDVEVLGDESVGHDEPTDPGASMLGAGAALAAGAVVAATANSELHTSDSEPESYSEPAPEVEPSAEVEPTSESVEETEHGSAREYSDFQLQETWTPDSTQPLEETADDVSGFDVAVESTEETSELEEEPKGFVEVTVTSNQEPELASETDLMDTWDADSDGSDQQASETVVQEEEIPDSSEVDYRADAETPEDEEDFHDDAGAETSDAAATSPAEYQFDPSTIAGVYAEPMMDYSTLDPQVTAEPAQLAETVDDVSEVPVDLDPSPSDDEIHSANVDDVELRDVGGQRVHDAGSIESELETESLNVGELTSEDTSAEPTTEINMLRGEAGFVPDSDTFQLETDPATGEFRLPQPPAIGSIQDSGTDEVIGKLEAMIQDAKELKDQDNPPPADD